MQDPASAAGREEAAGGDSPAALADLLTRFGKAYFKADAVQLALCVTADFEWRQHEGPGVQGAVIRCVEAVCAEILRRKAQWREVRYSDFENHFAPGLIVSTFEVAGIDEGGAAFRVRAVDLYPVREGRIARKDSFWKYDRAALRGA
jgi:ketosteroid isomerase-like protein